MILIGNIELNLRHLLNNQSYLGLVSKNHYKFHNIERLRLGLEP